MLILFGLKGLGTWNWPSIRSISHHIPLPDSRKGPPYPLILLKLLLAILPATSSTDHIIHKSDYHYHAPLLRALRRVFRPTIILENKMDNCRRLLPVLPPLAHLPDRGLIFRLRLGRPTVRHTQGGRERIRGQNTCRLCRLREASPTP